jgi:hypothetical protein
MSAIWDVHKVGSKTPFHEQPCHKAFYHPSPVRALKPDMKQTKLGTSRGGIELSSSADLDDLEFLKGCNVYRRGNAGRCDSPSLDESWPHSEAPSSVENAKAKKSI